MGIYRGIVLVLLVIDTVALCGLILIQRGKGGGLAGAFGGGGVEQAFGTRATTLAQKATGWLGAIYLALSIVLGLSLGMGRGSAAAPAENPEMPANTMPQKAALPAAPAAPAAPSNPGNAK
ncbi:MAG: preprotein translocase subunit SecG [Candidatus Brocadiia bacterium]